MNSTVFCLIKLWLNVNIFFQKPHNAKIVSTSKRVNGSVPGLIFVNEFGKASI